MKELVKIFVGTIAVVLGMKVGTWAGDKASKGIDSLVDAMSKKKDAEAPAATE